MITERLLGMDREGAATPLVNSKNRRPASLPRRGWKKPLHTEGEIHIEITTLANGERTIEVHHNAAG